MKTEDIELKILTKNDPADIISSENHLEDKFPVNLLKKCWSFSIFFVYWLCIAGVTTFLCVFSHQQYVKFIFSKQVNPFRTVNHGIWPGYRHEFFNSRLPFIAAERICRSRDNSSLLSFSSKDQEEKFDLYVSLNFWNEDENEYPDFKLWTSGVVLTRQLNKSTIVFWPEPNAKKELLKIRECAVRGENLVNAFGTSAQFWQERQIVKDYVSSNQPEDSKIGSKEGCWQHIKRNDLIPDSSYRFVCIKRIR